MRTSSSSSSGHLHSLSPSSTELCGAHGPWPASREGKPPPCPQPAAPGLVPRHTNSACAEADQAQPAPHLALLGQAVPGLDPSWLREQQVHLAHGTAPEPRHCTHSSLQQLLVSPVVCGLNLEGFPQDGKLTVLFKCNLISQINPAKTLKEWENLTCANPILSK